MQSPSLNVENSTTAPLVSAFIGPDDPRWAHFLDNSPHDFYHLPSYARMVSKYEGGTPVAFYAEAGESSFLLPLLIRPLPESLGAPQNWSDASSPYGYPGPLFHNADDPEIARLLVRAVQTEAVKSNVVSIFIRLHPLLTNNPQIFAEIGDTVRQGETVYVDLSKSEEEIWRDIRRDHREHIRKLQRLGFTVEFDNWEKLDGFIAAYRATMDRVSAGNFYRFPESYFHDLRESLGDDLHLCTVHAPDGEVGSGALFTLENGISQGHLAATLDKYLQLGPSKLMTYSQLIWLKSAGANRFHLGGGVASRADSLLYFKAGFSKLRSSFWTCSAIIDKNRYAQLISAAKDQFDPNQGFFPAYREAPVATAP